MKLSNRWQWALLTISILLFVSMEVFRQTHQVADVISNSPSGDFRLEHVEVGGPFFLLGSMAYLRVVNTRHPNEVYRSPLYNSETVDMTKFEDDKTVGIYWVTFRKQEKDFEIALPDWQTHWQNIFISNTPYTVYPN